MSGVCPGTDAGRFRIPFLGFEANLRKALARQQLAEQRLLVGG